MLDLSLLPDGGASWLDASGEHADIVISTRIRLARNLEGYAFTPRARDGERLRILTQVREAFGSLRSIEDGVLVRVDELPPEDRLLLHERHLVSKELAGLNEQPVRTGAAVYLSRGVGIMVNEEDHLRLQALHSGFHVADAFGVIERLDAELGNKVPYAFHNEFGYLTACPTNVGTGLRASVLIHLPGLVLTKEIGKVLAGLQQVGLTYRGMYGEGSEVVGNFFQISNQTTLGRSEGELLDYLVRVVKTCNRARRRSAAGSVARCGLYYRRQALACLWHAAICTQLELRRSDELSERRATGCRFETDKRSQCIYSQQAPDI